MKERGEGQLVSNVNVAIDGQKFSDPIALKGDLVWNAQRLTVNARLTTLRQLLDAKPAKAGIAIRSPAANITFDGNVTLAEATQVVGPLQLSSPSLAALMQWLGTELPNAKPLGSLSVKGELRALSDTIAISGASIALGETKANGTISAHLTSARPLVKANLKLSKLDVDKLSTGFKGARTITRAKLKPLSNGAASPLPPKSIEEILRGTSETKSGAGRFSPQVKGYTKQRGWSTEPINAAALKLFDADARLEIAGLRINGLTIGQTSLRTTLNSGSARADIDSISLYEGRGRGVVTARASSNGLKVGLNISVNSGLSATASKGCCRCQQNRRTRTP